MQNKKNKMQNKQKKKKRKKTQANSKHKQYNEECTRQVLKTNTVRRKSVTK